MIERRCSHSRRCSSAHSTYRIVSCLTLGRSGKIVKRRVIKGNEPGRAINERCRLETADSGIDRGISRTISDWFRWPQIARTQVSRSRPASTMAGHTGRSRPTRTTSRWKTPRAESGPNDWRRSSGTPRSGSATPFRSASRSRWTSAAHHAGWPPCLSRSAASWDERPHICSQTWKRTASANSGAGNAPSAESASPTAFRFRSTVPPQRGVAARMKS